MQQGSETLNLEEALRVLRRRVPLIVLCVIVVAGAAYAYSKHQTKKYTASASLAFSYSPLSQQIAGLPANSGNLLAQQASNLELVRLGDMAAKTANKLGHGLTEEEIADSLSISGEGESSVVDVSATATSPQLAAAIANTYTRQFLSEQQSANQQYFKSALTLVNRQLAKLSRSQRIGPDGLALQDRAQTLGLLAELSYGNVDIAQEAMPPTRPSSPKTSRNVALAILVGLFIGVGLAFVLERLDRRIRGPEDLEELYGLPMLGAVPRSAAVSVSASRRGNRPALPSTETEAFNLICTHLRLFNAHRDLRTILIVSAAHGDGRTTVARHLAEAAARLGSRVLLVEADLRHPTLAQQLGKPPAMGLADVLAGNTEMREATQSVDLGGASGEQTAGSGLDLLAAGTTTSRNPGAQLGSHMMADVLRQAKAAYDLVIVDTPPMGAVSDALALLAWVDGVVIVGRVGQSRRDQAESLRQVLANCAAPLVGVIANASRSPRASVAPSPEPTEKPLVSSSTNGVGPSDRVPAGKV